MIFLAGKNEIILITDAGEQQLELPAGFVPWAFHLLRVEADQDEMNISIDGNRLSWRIRGTRAFDRVQLFAHQADAVFAGFELTIENTS
jgi:hypothetical protein